MARHRSVLDPKQKAILANRSNLVPQVDWRAGRTWGVFAGWALFFGSASALTTLLCWLAAAHLIDDTIIRALTAALAALILLMIGALALKRAIPLRDTSGKIVAGNPRLNYGDLPLAPFLAMGWVMSFILLFFALFVLIRDPAGINTADFPFGIANVALIVSFFVFEIPFRVLWRAPAEKQEPDRDD